MNANDKFDKHIALELKTEQGKQFVTFDICYRSNISCVNFMPARGLNKTQLGTVESARELYKQYVAKGYKVAS